MLDERFVGAGFEEAREGAIVEVGGFEEASHLGVVLLDDAELLGGFAGIGTGDVAISISQSESG